jgi:hypothetical protein
LHPHDDVGSMNKLASTTLVAVVTAAVTLIGVWPKQTCAQEVAEWERQGEFDDDGARFGDIVVKGELVADGTVAGGWVLVRTLVNKSDKSAKCTVEERVTRIETVLDARVEPPGFTVVLRTQTFELGPHEKRAIGVPLAEALGSEITANLKTRASIQAVRVHAMETGEFTAAAGKLARQTFMRFSVDYLKPLPPGASAAPPANLGVTRPQGMSTI